MSKSFQEVFNEIRSNVTLSKKGKPVQTFSRSDFDKLMKAFVNEVEYKTDVVGVKDGKVEKTEVFPVKMLRAFLRKILIGFGVDKQEAERIMTDYEIKDVSGLYEFMSEGLFVYASANKKFDFLPKEDFVGSFTIEEVGETVGEFTDIRTKEKIKVRKKAHKILQKKSKCPKWLKSRA